MTANWNWFQITIANNNANFTLIRVDCENRALGELMLTSTYRGTSNKGGDEERTSGCTTLGDGEPIDDAGLGDS